LITKLYYNVLPKVGGGLVDDGVIDLSKENPNWYAVYTKSRHEKLTSKFLVSRGVVTFLPLRSVLSRWKDRKKLITVPLFPSYVFVNILQKDIHNVIYSKGVLRMVGINGVPYPIPNEQIESVEKLVKSDLKYDPYPYVNIGAEAEIKNGPLAGVVGKIIEKRPSKHIVVLSVDLIKRSVSVEVHVHDIELL
jgi:transcription antitermination factor NusG